LATVRKTATWVDHRNAFRADDKPHIRNRVLILPRRNLNRTAPHMNAGCDLLGLKRSSAIAFPRPSSWAAQAQATQDRRSPRNFQSVLHARP
jgi:hypothetical protein